MPCHDLAKQLSQYLFFFLFSFHLYYSFSFSFLFFFLLVSYIGMHEILARIRVSIVYKKLQVNLMGTPLSSPCQLRLGGFLSHLG